MPEKVVIIGSGPAGFAAAIYAARANLEPLLFEGAITPLGQLNLTTEVENYPGFPAGKLSDFISSSLSDKRMKYEFPDGPSEEVHAVTGPELMNLMRQQAENFGTRIVSDDIAEVDFSSTPFKLKPQYGDEVEAHTVVIATGASANYLGLESEEAFKNRGVSACAVCDGALQRFRDKPNVVVGGGDSAVEEATYLSK